MNVLVCVLTLCLRVLYVIAQPLFWLKSECKKSTLPPIQNALLKISATDLAAKIRTLEITSEEVILAYIQRIKDVNPILNAVAEDRFESALKDARDVDAYLRVSSENREELQKAKPLLGVPLTVKESCSLAGASFCVGTLTRVGVRAEKDGEVVAKLRASGAIPILVSNTPELCLSWETTNFITGTTNNAFDVTCTSSGSSGGEGALLGAGASLIGVGSDVAGSIRLPAMFNGVFGHKPTARVVSIVGHYPQCRDDRYPNYFAIGPMSRYATDLRLMVKIMAANDVLPELRLDEDVDLSEVKVYYMETQSKSPLFLPVQDEIINAIRRSVNFLQNQCNCTIIHDYKFSEMNTSLEIATSVLYDIKDIPNALKAGNEYLASEFLKCTFGLSKHTFNLLVFYLISYLCKTFISNESYIRKNESLKQHFTERLGKSGVFLYPTFVNSAMKHGELLFKILAVSYLTIFNTLGLPVTQVPCGFDRNGLPIGIQVVAAPKQDRLCFAVAQALEKCFGGWVPPQ